ncbi:MAG: hypothetical protein ABI633_01345 [Burkholderiales bacterium]
MSTSSVSSWPTSMVPSARQHLEDSDLVILVEPLDLVGTVSL